MMTPSTPPRNPSTASIAATPQTPSKVDNGFGCMYNFFTNKHIIITALFIANIVGAADATSVLALSATNCSFLFLGALALPGAVPDEIKGKKMVVLLVVGYAALAGLVALNVFAYLERLSVPTLGWSHLGALIGVAVVPMLIQQGPTTYQKCRERYSKQLHGDPGLSRNVSNVNLIG